MGYPHPWGFAQPPTRLPLISGVCVLCFCVFAGGGVFLGCCVSIWCGWFGGWLGRVFLFWCVFCLCVVLGVFVWSAGVGLFGGWVCGSLGGLLFWVGLGVGCVWVGAALGSLRCLRRVCLELALSWAVLPLLTLVVLVQGVEAPLTGEPLAG